MNPLKNVQTWLYHLGEVTPGRRAEIARSNADLVVIDFANGDQIPYAPAQIDALRGGDADRLIVSYLSIGEAEDYRAYWHDSWADTPPAFLADANPEWQDNFKVAYWNPAWQDIVFDQIDQIIAGGFNGLYLDIIDAYFYWEEQNPGQGDWYRQEMVRFVGEIHAYAQARLAEIGDTRPFAILGQNGEDLAAYPDYLAAVDGIGKEDLFYYYPNGAAEQFAPVPSGWLTGSQALLEQAHAAGVEVFVVEYIPPGDRSDVDLTEALSYLRGIDTPLYVASERDLTGIYEIYNSAPHPSGIRSLGTVGHDEMRATPGDDTVIGRAGDDTIFGRGGDDRLVGNAGQDLLKGGRGDDRLLGRKGDDVLFGNGGQDRLNGGAGRDRLNGGHGDDTLMGGAKGDWLHGGRGDDLIRGGRGADRIIGAIGDDTLFGGAGADVFVFRGNWGQDLVVDFELGTDRIKLFGADRFQSRNTDNGILLEFGDDLTLEIQGVRQDQIDDLF